MLSKETKERVMYEVMRGGIIAAFLVLALYGFAATVLQQHEDLKVQYDVMAEAELDNIRKNREAEIQSFRMMQSSKAELAADIKELKATILIQQAELLTLKAVTIETRAVCGKR